MPVEMGLKFGAIVGLDDMYAKWQSPEHFVDELNGRALVAHIEDLQDPDPRAVVNGRELKQSSACAGNPLEELDVHLQTMPRHQLLVSLPTLPIGPML